jgi:sugar phosphate isomerase/epimerase
VSAQSPPTAGKATDGACWCCGRATAEDALVRLGNHPEVGICVDCVHVLARRARDHQATVMRQQLRNAADSIRGKVMARGWHEHPAFGPALRWINRHLPW